MEDCWTCEVSKTFADDEAEYMTQSATHAPLAIDRLLDVRTTKWQKQLPMIMQCRSHSRRRTSECLFVTACSMDEYVEEKTTEKNLIVCSGISEAETTNNKTALDVLYWSYTDTKHRAAFLRQQSFLFGIVMLLYCINDVDFCYTTEDRRYTSVHTHTDIYRV